MLTALFEGAVGGLAIAVPVGPIAVLIVDQGMRRGFVTGAVSGLGAASADLLYATVAVIGGLAAAEALEPYSWRLRLVGVLVLGAIVAIRTSKLLKPDPDGAPTPARPESGLLKAYFGFLGLTLLNPLTVTYFVALILGLEPGRIGEGWERLLFVVGAFGASALWQVFLAAVGAVFHRRLSLRARLVTGLVGNAVIAALAVRLALQL